MTIAIDKNKCKKDKICILECPFGLIIEDKDGFPISIEGTEHYCSICGHCISVCPHGALILGEIKAESLIPIQQDIHVNIESAEQFLRSRRSIRNYKDKPVPREILSRVIESTRWAPTAMNLQPVHWLVIEKKSEVHRLAGLVAEALRQNNAIPFAVEAWDRGEDKILRNAPHLIIAHASAQGFDPEIDCTIALTYMELAAHAHGLGTCWAGMFMMMAKKYQPLMEALKLPEGHNVYGAMMIGYPKYRYQRLPERHTAKIEWR